MQCDFGKDNKLIGRTKTIFSRLRRIYIYINVFAFKEITTFYFYKLWVPKRTC